MSRRGEDVSTRPATALRDVTERISTRPPPCSMGHAAASSVAWATRSRASFTLNPKHQVLGLHVRAVGDHGRGPAKHPAFGRQRRAGVLQVPIRFQLANPGQPRLHPALRLLGRSHGRALLLGAGPEQKNNSLVCALLALRPPLDRGTVSAAGRGWAVRRTSAGPPDISFPGMYGRARGLARPGGISARRAPQRRGGRP
jgi:hypothetical protein